MTSLILKPVPRDQAALFEFLNPLIESWSGTVVNKGVPLLQLQVNDPDQYAGDFQNLDTTGSPTRKALRATASSHSLTVNGSGITASSLTIVGTLLVGGTSTMGAINMAALSASTGTFSGLLTASAGIASTTLTTSGLLTANSLVVTTTTTQSGAVVMGSTLNVSGAATASSLTVTGAFQVGGSSIMGALAMAGLSASTATFSGVVTMQTSAVVTGAFQVGGTSTLGNLNMAALSATSATVSGAVVLQSTVAITSGLTIGGAIDHDGTSIGFFGSAPSGKETVTGSRGGNVALANLLSALANYGLIVNSTT